MFVPYLDSSLVFEPKFDLTPCSVERVFLFLEKSKQYNYASHSPVLSVIMPKRQLTYKKAQELINERKKEKFELASEENLAQQLCKL